MPLARLNRKFSPPPHPLRPPFPTYCARAVPNDLSVAQNTPVLSIFPPLFRQKRPKFCPSLPAFYRQLSLFRRNKPAFCRKPAGWSAKAPRFLLSVSVRAPSRPTTLRRSSCFRRFPEARFPHFLRPQCQPSGVLRKVPHNSPSPPSVRAAPPSFLPFVKPTAVKSAPHHCTFAHLMRQKHRIPARKTQICALLFAGCHRNCIFAVSYILVHGIYRAANRHLPWRQR